MPGEVSCRPRQQARRRMKDENNSSLEVGTKANGPSALSRRQSGGTSPQGPPRGPQLHDPCTFSMTANHQPKSGSQTFQNTIIINHHHQGALHLLLYLQPTQWPRSTPQPAASPPKKPTSSSTTPPRPRPGPWSSSAWSLPSSSTRTPRPSRPPSTPSRAPPRPLPSWRSCTR